MFDNNGPHSFILGLDDIIEGKTRQIWMIPAARAELG